MRRLVFPFLCLTLPLVAHDPAKPAEPVVDAAEVAFFQARVQQHPEDPTALARLGGLRLRQARAAGSHDLFVAAEGCFRQLPAVDPGHAAGRRGLVQCLIGRHAFREALTLAREAVERLPDEPEGWALLGDAHFALGRYAEAEMCFRRMVAYRADLQATARLAQVEEVRGRHDEALRLLHLALAACDDDAERAWCHTMIGDLRRNQGDALGARRAYEAADPHTSPYAAMRLAELDLGAGDLRSALHHAHAAYRAQPENPAYGLMFAAVLDARGKTTRAAARRDALVRRLEMQVDGGDLGHARYLIQGYVAQGRLEEALALAEQERDTVRADSEAHEWVGWINHLLGRSEAACTELDRALAPGLGQTRMVLRAGIAHAGAGHLMKAASLLQLGLARGYPSDRALEQQARAALCALQEAQRDGVDFWASAGF